MKFLGYVSGRQKIALVQQASVVVVPSLLEAFGIVALEALSCGRPVVASRVGGLQEIVSHGETGLLFDPGNVVQLAESVISLLQDAALRHRYGHNARRASESFAWPSISDKMIKVYVEHVL